MLQLRGIVPTGFLGLTLLRSGDWPRVANRLSIRHYCPIINGSQRASKGSYPRAPTSGVGNDRQLNSETGSVPDAKQVAAEQG